MPAHHLVVAGVPGDPGDPAAVHVHHVDVGVAVVIAGEGDPRPVGRELGMAFLAVVDGQAGGGAARNRRGPDVLAADEHNGVAAHVGEAQQRLGRDRRPEGGREAEEQRGAQAEPDAGGMTGGAVAHDQTPEGVPRGCRTGV